MINQRELQQAIELRFECLRCGHCCKGDGLVEVGAVEVDRMAEHLGLTRKAFVQKYATKASDSTPAAPKWWLKDKINEERWCIFLEVGADGLYGCAVNEAKPDQCRSFPAKWRNSDSLRSCAGLRALVRTLKDEAAQSKAGT